MKGAGHGSLGNCSWAAWVANHSDTLLQPCAWRKPAISHADVLTCFGSCQALLLAQDLLLLDDLLLLVGHSLLQLLHKEPDVMEEGRRAMPDEGVDLVQDCH